MSNESPLSKVRVFTLAPDWGLPTVGPFDLKLLAWLELAGVPYEQVVEANPAQGDQKVRTPGSSSMASASAIVR
jgi:hypothetical protein